MADDSVESPNINLNNVRKLSLYLIERPASSLQRPISQCCFKKQMNLVERRRINPHIQRMYKVQILCQNFNLHKEL
jgi:hypothetical protein